MKKLLRLLFLLLLLGFGFLYVIKNPTLPISQKILTTLGINIETGTQQTGVDLTNCLSYFDGCNTCMVSGGVINGCTKMFCDTPAEPQCLEYVRTGMDLTNCVSYFDGCNNCSVKDGRPDACTLMYCETPAEPKCNEYATGTENTGTENTGTAGLANPASVNCENKGGTLEILEGTGGQYGMCHLPNGTSCEERAYMRGECGAPSAGASTGSAGKVCSMLAKQCPDGSYVTETGPNCEFSPCPGE